MAHVLIDGYNLIGIAHENLEKARNELIMDLLKYAQTKQHDITVVFDGWKTGMKDQTRTKSGHVTVIFTRLRETADTVIKNMLTPTAKPWIVVSSDRDVHDYAARKDFAAITSNEFEEKLFKTLHSDRIDSIPDMWTDDEDDYSTSPHKGNPNKLSKREKKKQLALKKL